MGSEACEDLGGSEGVLDARMRESIDWEVWEERIAAACNLRCALRDATVDRQ